MKSNKLDYKLLTKAYYLTVKDNLFYLFFGLSLAVILDWTTKYLALQFTTDYIYHVTTRDLSLLILLLPLILFFLSFDKKIALFLGAFIGGCCANLFDLKINGKVLDWISAYNGWYINLADITIFVSIIILISYAMFYLISTKHSIIPRPVNNKYKKLIEEKSLLENSQLDYNNLDKSLKKA